MLKLFQSAILKKQTDRKPGTILQYSSNGTWLVACVSDCLSIGAVQLEGKRRMTVAEFTRGYHLEEGKILG